MNNSYWNYEADENIICPYCGQEYEPSYEDTYIGGELADCYTEEKKTYTCDKCGKKIHHVWLSGRMEVSNRNH